MGSGNSYKKLFSTTMILAIGSFSSKVLVFLLVPFYTRVLSQSEYGTANLITQACNLLMPLVSAGIANAVIRFALQKGSNKKGIFSMGLVTVLCGGGVLLLLSPILSLLEFVQGYTFLAFLYVLMSALHTVCAQFVQGMKYTKLFALDGVLRTLMTIGFNILLLVVFDLGIAGYVLATILSDFLSTLFLWFMASLGRYFSLSHIDRDTRRTMLRYSVPLIPTMICVWIVSMSDQYMIEYILNDLYSAAANLPNQVTHIMGVVGDACKQELSLPDTYAVGSAAVAIYVISNKVPHILSIVAGIFGDAWQISIVSEDPKKQRRFFSNVFATYQCVALVGSSGLIMTAKIMVTLLAAPSYYSAWRYIPVLVLGITCSCLATFLGSIYMVERQSVHTLTTTLLGAFLNIGLNLLTIPRMGVMGAALSTCLSYLLMFLVRGIHTRKYIPVSWRLHKFLPSCVLVVLQAALMLWEVPLWPLWQILCFLLITLLNIKELFRSLFRLF